jgi:hypothetical protein
MSWFSRKPTQEKYIQAAVTVASNLYLQTISGAQEASAPLQFGFPDSRYRYMIFCLSAVVTSALAYDEKKKIQPETLINGCLQFANWTAAQNPHEYFDDPATSPNSADHASLYLKEFLKQWSLWPALENEGRNMETIDLISSIIHTTESSEPISQSDEKRLGPLALNIDCRLPTMRSALIELANR